jgi:hypothetical protein
MEEILICHCGDCDSWIVGKNKLICQTCGQTVPLPLAQVTLPDNVSWQSKEIKLGTENAFNPTSRYQDPSV